MRKINLIVITLVFAFAFQACRSGKKAYQKGNYYLSVIQSCDKLRRSPNNKKARIALADAYPLAIQTIELNNTNLQSSNSISKWKTIVRNYNNINRMYEEILRSPAALDIIPKPLNRYAELENAKKNAAEESYAKGIELLNKNNRNDAILAYNSFMESQSFVPNYRDSDKKLDEARRLATIFVLVKQDPVPANFAVSGTYFKNKIDEYLHGPEARKNFIEYYRPDELAKLGLRADHELTLRYQDFSVGNVYVKERVEQLTRDSVVVGSLAGTTGGTTTGGTTLGATDSGNTRNTDSRGTSGNTGLVGVSETSGAKDNSGSTNTMGTIGKVGTSGTSEGNSTSGGTSKNPRSTDTKGNTGSGNTESTDTKEKTGNSGNTGSSDTKGTTGNSGNTGSTDTKGNSGTSGNNNSGNSSSGSSSSDNKNKVSVCHNGKTLSISSSALRAHIAHGDSSGPCTASDTGKENTGNSGTNDNTGKDDKKDEKTNSGDSKDKGNNTPETNSTDDKPKGDSDTKGKDDVGNTDKSGGKSDSGKKGNSSGGSGSGKMNLTVAEVEEEAIVSNNLAVGSVPVYGTAKATLTTYEKTITSKALLSMTLTEVGTGRVLKQDLFPAEHIWISKWATFNGDERALSDEQYDISQQKELPPPTRDESFNVLSEEFYKQVTENILRFYNNF